MFAFCNALLQYTFFKIILLIISLSAASMTLSYIYYMYCAPTSIMGIFTNVFTISSPICTAINRLQSTISDHATCVISCVSVAFVGFVKYIFTESKVAETSERRGRKYK